mmetsp:Transcript_50746/g.147774  ORF Transcript_50746/g.147774 Transcript_50746/m.147774 type:complete len:267 (+) Transcript_50746:155-955(+)
MYCANPPPQAPAEAVAGHNRSAAPSTGSAALSTTAPGLRRGWTALSGARGQVAGPRAPLGAVRDAGGDSGVDAVRLLASSEGRSMVVAYPVLLGVTARVIRHVLDRILVWLLWVRLGPLHEQPLDPSVLAPRRILQHRAAALISCEDVGVLAQQGRSQPLIAEQGCQVQRGRAVGEAHVSAIGERDLEPAFDDGGRAGADQSHGDVVVPVDDGSQQLVLEIGVVASLTTDLLLRATRRALLCLAVRGAHRRRPLPRDAAGNAKLRD